MFSALKSKAWELKRRSEQKIVEGIGKAEASTDVDFDQLTAQFAEAEKLVETVYKSTKAYMEGLAKLTEASTAMADSYANAFLAAHGTNQFGGSELTTAATAINKLAQEQEKVLASKSLEPLRKWAESFRGIKTRMEELNKARLDYDYYQRKVQGLKENPKTDKATMDDKLKKLERTKHAYDEGLFKLKLELATLMEKMCDLLHTPFAALVSSQMDLLKGASAAMVPLQPFYASEEALQHLKPFLPEDLTALVASVASERAASQAAAGADFPLPPSSSATAGDLPSPPRPVPSAPPAPPPLPPVPPPAAASAPPPAPAAMPMDPAAMEAAMKQMAAQMAAMGMPVPPVPPAAPAAAAPPPPPPPANAANPFEASFVPPAAPAHAPPLPPPPPPRSTAFVPTGPAPSAEAEAESSLTEALLARADSGGPAARKQHGGYSPLPE